MKPRWLIEDFDADNNYQRLADEVKRQGMDYELITYIPFESGNYDRFDDNECVIVQSSLNLANQLLKEKRWIPNAWLTLENYKCSQYYAALGKYLFNDKYVMMPVAEAKRRINWIFENFGMYDSVFMRPNSGFKTFTGKLFKKQLFEKDWEWVEEFTSPGDLVVVSTPKLIRAEWRFIIAEGEVISGSLYRKNNIPEFERNWPDNVFNLVQKVAEDYNPDPMWTADICMGYDNNPYLLEIGCFSCAGLYGCDLEPVVKRAAEIAVKEWKDLYDVVAEGSKAVVCKTT
jgi:hypothetical protein